MSCKFYYFYCGDYHCGKCDKDVNSDWYYRYCRNYDYGDCPVFKGYMDEPANDGDNGGGSSGCFLTSACVSAKGLPDDCCELQTLRNYRDNWLAKAQGGKDAIEHYYSVAPKIVSAIDKLDEHNEIYEMIYNKMVMPCIDFIKQEKYHEAFELYKDMTLKLEAQYC